jgi:hypothetical protein
MTTTNYNLSFGAWWAVSFKMLYKESQLQLATLRLSQ